MTRVSIIEEKPSRYTPSTNQVWEEKEEGSNDESSSSKHKTKQKNFQSSKENIRGYTTTNQVGEKKKRGVMMKAAIQNAK